MTITLDSATLAWERGYDARNINRPFSDRKREPPRHRGDWEVGWNDAEDTILNRDEFNLTSLTLDSYTVQDETGAVVKP